MSDLIRRPQYGSPVRQVERPFEDPFAPEWNEQKIDLRHYWMVLLRRKWLILAVAVTILAGVLLQAYTATPLYTAYARLQIDPEPVNILPFENTFQYAYYYQVTESYQKTQAEVLRSRALAERMVKRLDLVKDPVFNMQRRPGFFTEWQGRVMGWATGLVAGTLPSQKPPQVDSRRVVSVTDIERAADAFRGSLGVSLVTDTRLMQVSYTSHDPQFAAYALNVLLEEYIEMSFEKRLNASQQAQDFLERQLFDLQKKVEKSEEDLIAYARANDIVSIDEREAMSLQKLGTLNQEIVSVESRLIAESARYESYRGATIEDFPAGLDNETITQLEDQLFTLEQQMASLSTRYGPEWPEVVQVQRQIDTVNLKLRKEREQALALARAQYSTLLGHGRRLESALEEAKVQAARLHQDSIQYNILKREADTNKQLYTEFLQKLKEAGISAGLKSNNIQVVDTAQPPGVASWPSKRRNAMMGLMVGLVLGLGLAFLLDYVDNTLKTPEDVEHAVGLPTLAVVPVLQGPRLARMLPASSGQEGEVREDKRNLWAESETWEAYRALRTSILLSHSDKPPQTILVTSALPGEGKSTTSLHMAMTMAQTGARTLLVDLDLRKPALERMLGLEKNGGMSGYLSGNSDLSSQIQQTVVPHLYAVAAGPHPPNPAELLGSGRMHTAFRLLRDHFKYIIIDSPPVMSVTDPLVLANQVDGVVLVIHGGKTPRDAVRRSSDRIHSVGGKILGGMINNVDVRKSDYAYYYRYYYYYGDYYKEKPGKSA